MEKILVSGDSWSNPNFKSKLNPDYKNTFTWSDMLKGDVTNISINGLDNVSIVNNALKSIYENKPDRVIIALSCWSRYATPNYRMNPMFLLQVATKITSFANYECDRVEFKRMLRHLAGMMDVTLKESDNIHGFISHFIKDYIPTFIQNTCLALLNIIHICEYLKIKIHIFQSFAAFSCGAIAANHRANRLLETTFEQELISSDLFLDLYETKADLIGYPWISSAGGFTARYNLHKEEDLLGNGDGHPNEKGHRKIGEWFNASYTDYEI